MRARPRPDNAADAADAADVPIVALDATEAAAARELADASTEPPDLTTRVA